MSDTTETDTQAVPAPDGGAKRAPKAIRRKLTIADLRHALRAGLADYRYAPGFGVPFAGVYVVGGLFLIFVSGGFVWQTIILALGFPLFAPFAAIALYEVSRRIERGEALDWRAIYGVIWRERGGQVPWLGALIVIYFLFYSFLAHMTFALFMGLSAMTNISTSFDAFLTPEGLTMIAVQLCMGAAVGLLLFALTVISLPYALDRDVDFITAMITSFCVVRDNAGVMILWALLLGGSMAVAMIPAFLGLFIVLPILGHASWHLYRRAVIHPD
jgi:uncharacterized membrane protein